MTTQEPPLLPFSGVRVLEFGHFLAGPFAATLLADFGAEVIKVEPPNRPDVSRYGFGARDPRDPDRSQFFAVLGRNKRSIAVDPRSEEGRELLLDLVARSDAIVENFRPGTMESLGLGPDDLTKVNSDLIYLRVSGFGQSGPSRERAGVDDVGVATGGLVYVSGFPDGTPVRPGLTVADHGAALMGAFGVAMALLARLRHGCGGQVVDVSLYDPVLMMLDDIPAGYARTGVARERLGNFHEYAAPNGIYRACDGGWVTLSASTDRLFNKLATAMGWAAEEIAQFGSTDRRIEQRASLDQKIATWVAARAGDDVVNALNAVGVPVGRVNDAAQLLSDPHMTARGDFTSLHDDLLGEFVIPTPKPLLSKTPGGIHDRAPRFGEHTEAVLSSVLEYSSDEVKRLRGLGAIS